jgi:hypothetical protein
LQFGIDPARRLALERAGPGTGDGPAFDAVARQEVRGAPGLVGRLRDRRAPLVPAADVLRRGPEEGTDIAPLYGCPDIAASIVVRWIDRGQLA